MGADPPPSSIQPWEDPRWLQHLCSQPPLLASGVCSSGHEAPGKLKLSSLKARPDRLSLLPLFNLLKEMRRKSNAVPQGTEPVPPLGRKVGGCQGAHWVLRVMLLWLLIMLGGRSCGDRLAVPSMSR